MTQQVTITTGWGTCDFCKGVNVLVASDNHPNALRICRPCAVKTGGETVATHIFGA